MTSLPYALAACFVAMVAAWCFVQWLHAERDTSAVRREMADLRAETDAKVAVVAKYEDRLAVLELKAGFHRG